MVCRVWKPRMSDPEGRHNQLSPLEFQGNELDPVDKALSSVLEACSQLNCLKTRSKFPSLFYHN
jgi:hypothetical protein